MRSQVFFRPETEKQDATLFWPAHQATFDRIAPALILADDRNVSLIRNNVRGYGKKLALIADGTNADVWAGASALPQLESHDVAFLQHSSGTTGLKKGVELSHNAVCRQIDSYAKALAISKDDIIASWLPLYHDMGLIACFVMPAALGLTTIHLNPFEWVLKPWSLLDVIEKYRATLSWLPNFAFHHIVRTAPVAKVWNLSSLRAAINCRSLANQRRSSPSAPDSLNADCRRRLCKSATQWPKTYSPLHRQQ